MSVDGGDHPAPAGRPLGRGRYRAWCITDHLCRCLGQITTRGLVPPCTFFVGQRERCPTTGREHEQCYAEFDRPMRLKEVKDYFSNQELHLERRFGTQEQAINYCQKEETCCDPAGRVRVGRPVRSRELTNSDADAVHRSNFEDFYANSRNSRLDQFDRHPSWYLRHYRPLQSLLLDRCLRAPCYRRLEVRAFIGPPGTHKTSTAYMDEPLLYRVSPPSVTPGAVWWDGYSGQECVLFDDFDGWVPFRTFLQWLDVYPLLLPVKGGFVVANYTKVYITSNLDPYVWYQGVDPAPLLRRLKEVKYFT